MRRERGVALITALLVVALATLAATALLTASNASLHRAATLRDTEQAWWYGRGVESWVLGILAYDAQHSKDHDGYDEAWAQPVDYLPVDEGVVRGRVVDAQGLFNLNNLALGAQRAGQPPGQGQQQANALVYQRQFKRLIDFCDCLETGGDNSDTIVRAVVDWMSPSQGATGSDGAKDSYYLGLTPPYRSGQRRFAAPSELLAVRGVTPALYKALRPSIVALPSTAATKINVNTAPIEVLRAACEVGDQGALEQWVKRVQQNKQPTADLGEFFRTGCNINGATAANGAATFFDVTSSYFQMRGEVVVGTGRLALYSLIFRGQGQSPRVVARDSE